MIVLIISVRSIVYRISIRFLWYKDVKYSIGTYYKKDIDCTFYWQNRWYKLYKNIECCFECRILIGSIFLCRYKVVQDLGDFFYKNIVLNVAWFWGGIGRIKGFFVKKAIWNVVKHSG